MDIEEVNNEYKISVPIMNYQEIAELDMNIKNNYKTIFDQISEAVSRDRDILALKRIIEYQHKRIIDLENKNKQ